MRILWEALENADRLVFKLLDRVDDLAGRKPLLERTQKQTENVRPPQRVIEFGKN